MKEVQAVAKKDRNENQRFNFRGIDAVVNAIGPALRKHNGFIVPISSNVVYESMTSSRGGSLNVARVKVRFGVYGTEGDPIEGEVNAEAFDSGDKATAKAMSVAFRTFILQTFSLPTDEPDPDSQSYEVVAPKKVSDEFLQRVENADSLETLTKLFDEAVKEGFSETVRGVFTKKKEALNE
jgi:hypothetical protein